MTKNIYKKKCIITNCKFIHIFTKKQTCVLKLSTQSNSKVKSIKNKKKNIVSKLIGNLYNLFNYVWLYLVLKCVLYWINSNSNSNSNSV